MASEVSICNGALLKVGAKTITSLLDGSNEAKICNEFYAKTRDAVLRAHPWNFAIARQSLVRLNPDPIFGYGAQYQLPTDPFCLRVLTFNDSSVPHLINGVVIIDVFSRFKIEGRKLLTNETEANIVYVARIVDLNLFDPLALEALGARLTAEIAYPVSKNSRLVSAMWDLYASKLQEARSIDGMEGTPDSFESDEIGSVRI